MFGVDGGGESHSDDDRGEVGGERDLGCAIASYTTHGDIPHLTSPHLYQAFARHLV